MNKQDIIAHITPEIYAIECDDAWRAAPFTGGNDASQFYTSDTPFTINRLIWDTDNGLNDSQKIDLVFAVYRDLPCYTLLSEVFIHQYRDLSADVQAIYWQHIAVLLAQPEIALAEPIVYTLAVDFFEDRELCSQVWERLTSVHEPEQFMVRFLEASAAVPFALKEQLYQQLLANPRMHQAIYTSLRASYYSLYGDIDKVQARSILGQLSIAQEGADDTAFQHALQTGHRYANHYADRQTEQ